MVSTQTIATVLGFLIGFFAALTLLHLFLFLFYKRNKSNLYYSVFSFCMAWLGVLVSNAISDSSGNNNISGSYAMTFLAPLLLISLSTFLYSLFYDKMPKLFWIIFGLAVLSVILHLLKISFSGYLSFALALLVVIESIRVVIAAIRKKKDGAWIIGSGVLASVGSPVVIIIITMILFKKDFDLSSSSMAVFGTVMIFMLAFSILSISVSMSVFLARQFAKTNKNLQKQLEQVKELSLEKQNILETQKEQLEIQVTERTSELAQKNKDIVDSIHYAKRIQNALLPTEKYITKNLKRLMKK